MFLMCVSCPVLLLSTPLDLHLATGGGGRTGNREGVGSWRCVQLYACEADL